MLLECHGEQVGGVIIGEDSSNTGFPVKRDRGILFMCVSHVRQRSIKVGYHGASIVGKVEQTLLEDIYWTH